jgi:hypothetical protein
MSRSVRWAPQSSDAMGAPFTPATPWCLGVGMGKPCATLALAWASRVHTLALAWASRVHTLALAWASRVHTLALAWASRVHTLALAWASRVHTLALAWASRVTLALVWADFGLGVHKLPLACADFGLGRATLASEKKKKICSEFAQILHGCLLPHSKHFWKKSFENSQK